MIRHAPGGSGADVALELIDIRRNYGNFSLGYRFPHGADVDLVGAGDLNLSGQRDWKKANAGGWAEVLHLTPSGLTSTHVLAPEANAHLGHALKPLIADFRAAAGRLAVLFWSHLDDPELHVRFIPVLAMKTSWGPGRRRVEVYLKRHTDAAALEWLRRPVDGKVVGLVKPEILGSQADLAQRLRQVASDPGVLREVAVLFAAGTTANAKISDKRLAAGRPAI